jgi:hypothetical protein
VDSVGAVGNDDGVEETCDGSVGTLPLDGESGDDTTAVVDKGADSDELATEI